MIKVFYGENRTAAMEAAKKFLGAEYEVVEGENLASSDLPNLFWGSSLFNEKRTILVRDLLANKAVSGEIANYLTTNHTLAMVETKVDKRANVYKALVGKVEFREFKLPRDENAGLVFDIYNMAKRDGQKAVKMVEQIEQTEEPMMFVGLMVAQAIRDYTMSPNAKNKQVLKELAKLDINIKSTNMDPWLLIKSMIMKIK